MTERDDMQLVIKAFDEFSSIMGKYKEGLGDIESSSEASAAKMSRYWDGVKAGAVVATAAVAAVTYEMYKAAKAAIEAEAAEAKMLATLRSTGAVSGMTKDSLLELASAMQRTTTFGDDTVMTAESLMLTFTKVNKDVFPTAIQLAADMSIGMGQDLKSSVIQLGKALNDPITGVAALGRVGVQLSEVQKQQIEDFMAVNDVASAQKIILGELATQFGGQAAAEADTFGGRLIQLKNAFGDVQEEIGFIITKNTFFVNGVKIATEYLAAFAQKISENRQYLMELTKTGIVAFVDGVGMAVEALRFFHNGWLGIKLVGAATAVVLSDSLRVVFEGLRLVLKPLDLIFDGLVKLGAIDSNPFDGMEAALGQFQLSSRDVMKDVLKDIESTNFAYDKASQAIAGFSGELKKLKVEQAKESGKPGKAGALGTGGEVDPEAAKKAAETYQQSEDKIMAVVLATGKLGASKEELMALEALEYSMTGATIDQVERYTAALQAMADKQAAIMQDKERAKSMEELDRLKQNDPYKQADENSPYKTASSGSQIETIYTEYQMGIRALETYNQQRIEKLQEYNTAVIQEMVTAGFAQSEIERQYRELSTVYAAAEADLTIAYAEKKRDFQLSAAEQTLGAMSNIMQNLYVATGSKNKAIFETMKAFAIAEAIIDTYKGATSAYAALAGIPIIGPALGTAAAAAAIAAGLARVAQIRSTNPGTSTSIGAGGSANPTYSGGSTTAYPVPERLETKEAKPTQNITVNVYNPLSEQNWQRIVEDNIVPALKDASDRNIKVSINNMG